jgi:intracellular multiplication protein IcmV
MAQGKSRPFIKNFMDLPRWAGVSSLKAGGQSIKSLAKSLFIVKRPEIEETFEAAVKRLGLTEESIAHRQRWYAITATIYLVAAILMLVYCAHLFWLGHHLSLITSVALTAVLLSFFFRDHFWYTQMKNRRLGFTFKEWVQSVFGH